MLLINIRRLGAYSRYVKKRIASAIAFGTIAIKKN